MRAWWAVLGWVACTGGSTDQTDGTVDASDTTDGDTAPTGSDTGTEPGATPRLRALHVGATLPGQDMYGNGNPGQPPLVDLMFGEAWPAASAWATRPASPIVFTFHDDGAKKPWSTFSYTLEEDHAYSLLVMGTLDDRQVLVTDDAVTDVPGDKVRMRWTHAAPSLAKASVVLRDVASKAVYGGGKPLAYGESIETDEDLGRVQLWIDLDGDETCSVGELFETFERSGGDYFHVAITDTAEGELFLQGHTLNGQAPTRGVAGACP